MCRCAKPVRPSSAPTSSTTCTATHVITQAEVDAGDSSGRHVEATIGLALRRTLVVDPVTGGTAGALVMQSDLTLRGVTRPVTMEVEFHQAGPAMGGAYKAGFDGEATIKRSEFGINYALPAVSDEVELHLEGEFVLKS